MRYFERRERGWVDDARRRQRLAETLTRLDDLLLWTREWYPEPEPSTGESLAEILAPTVEAERHDLGISSAALKEIRMGKEA